MVKSKEIRALLQRGDILEADNMLVTSDALSEVAQETIASSVPVTRGYSMDEKDLLGKAKGFDMEGNDLHVTITLDDDETYDLLNDGKYGLGICAMTDDRGPGDDVFVVKKLTLSSIGIFPKEDLIQPMGEDSDDCST